MKFWIVLLLVACVAIVFFVGPCAYEYETYDDEPVVLAVKK